MESELKDLREDLKKLIIDVALIKNILADEGELSDWAKEKLKNARKKDGELSDYAINELEEARMINDSECISHEDVKKIEIERLWNIRREGQFVDYFEASKKLGL